VPSSDGAVVSSTTETVSTANCIRMAGNTDLSHSHCCQYLQCVPRCRPLWT